MGNVGVVMRLNIWISIKATMPVLPFWLLPYSLLMFPRSMKNNDAALSMRFRQ